MVPTNSSDRCSSDTRDDDGRTDGAGSRDDDANVVRSVSNGKRPDDRDPDASSRIFWEMDCSDAKSKGGS